MYKVIGRILAHRLISIVVQIKSLVFLYISFSTQYQSTYSFVTELQRFNILESRSVLL
jgi:hypothetical protein